MNKSKFRLRQKLTAGAFLLVFLFVHCIKLVHYHEGSTTHQSVSEHHHTAAAQNDCAICDYHFVKDAVDETPVVFTADAEIVSPLYIDYLSQRLTSIGLTSSGRGPPALI